MPTPSVTGTPQGFAFTASGTVVTYTGGGDTGSGVYDVLCVNSDNTVSTPAGWDVPAQRVVNQGSYVFVRAGGTTTATIALGGGVSTNTSVLWIRMKDCDSLDTGADAVAGADASPLSNTPAITSGVMASASSAMIAFAALHALGGGTPASPVWSAGYVQQTTATIGGTTTGVYGNAAVKTPAGTAAESPSLSWTNAASNRYILVIAFTGTAGLPAVVPDGIAVAVAVGPPAVGYDVEAGPDGLALPVELGPPFLSVTPDGLGVSVTLGDPATVGAAPVRRRAGWQSYGNALRFNAEQARAEAVLPPRSCPVCGEALEHVSRGGITRHCPGCGWTYGA